MSDCVATPAAIEVRGAGEPSAIVHSKIRGYEVYTKNDGVEYVKAFLDYLDGGPALKEYYCGSKPNRASLITINNRKFVIKVDRIPVKGLERKLWRGIIGPFHSRLMRQVNQAVNEGCDHIIDILLVAEKMHGRLATETYFIMEYAEGKELREVENRTEYYERIREAFEKVHSFGLSLGDPHPGNIMVTDSGKIKLIDYSVRGTQWTGRAKDRIRCRKHYGIEIAIPSLVDRFFDLFVLLHLKKAAIWRKWRGKHYTNY